MAHRYTNHPILAELDSIAQELDTTGNPDLATLVDEVSVELVTAHKRQAEAAKAKAKEKAKAKAKPKRSKKNKKATPSAKEAAANYSSRRARIASAMKRIAKAQVAELEDIASELLKEGSKKTALEVLKIAEDLDSEYDYSSDSHGTAESKGDASKRFDRAKANKPKAKMDADEKEDLELPFGQKGEGYPMKQSSFDKEMEALIRLAMEDDSDEEFDTGGVSDEESEDDADLDMDLEDSEDSDSEDEESEDDADDMDLEGLDFGDEEEPAEGGEELDFEGLDLGEGDDELAAMMEAMDHEASDRMYEADESEDDMELDMAMEEDSDEADEADEPMEEEEESEDDMGMDDDEDKEGLLGFEVGVETPVGGLHLGQAQRKNLMTLAKKLAAKGEKKKAAQIARLARSK